MYGTCAMVFSSPPAAVLRVFCVTIRPPLWYCRLPAHLNIAQAKAMDDRVLSRMRISFEKGLCDFTEHAWGLTNMSLGERVG